MLSRSGRSSAWPPVPGWPGRRHPFTTRRAPIQRLFGDTCYPRPGSRPSPLVDRSAPCRDGSNEQIHRVDAANGDGGTGAHPDAAGRHGVKISDYYRAVRIGCNHQAATSRTRTCPLESMRATDQMRLFQAVPSRDQDGPTAPGRWYLYSGRRRGATACCAKHELDPDRQFAQGGIRLSPQHKLPPPLAGHKVLEADRARSLRHPTGQKASAVRSGASWISWATASRKAPRGWSGSSDRLLDEASLFWFSRSSTGHRARRLSGRTPTRCFSVPLRIVDLWERADRSPGFRTRSGHRPGF